MIPLNKKSSSKPTFNEETILWQKGIKYVIGIDEVGRGAFAGPIVVGAVIFKDGICSDYLKERVNDSKLLKFMERKRLSKEIKKECFYHKTEVIGVSIINRKGIGKATEIAFRKVISNIIKDILNIKDQNFFVLVDGFHVKYMRGIGLKNQKAIIKGDQKSMSIAAASIIAKDYRDSIMLRLSKKYPEYMWGRNKGYGTNDHQNAIKEKGLSRLHRRSFNLEKFM